MVPVHGAAGVGSLVRDTLKAASGASATVWAALLDSRQLSAMDASVGRGIRCDLVEVHAAVKFGNDEGLSAVHSYVPRRGRRPRPAPGPRRGRRRSFPACSGRSSARELGGARDDVSTALYAHPCCPLPFPTLRRRPGRTFAAVYMPPDRCQLPSRAVDGAAAVGRNKIDQKAQVWPAWWPFAIRACGCARIGA